MTRSERPDVERVALFRLVRWRRTDRARALIAERMPDHIERVLAEARSILDDLGHPDRAGAP